MGEKVQAVGVPTFGDLTVGQAFQFATSRVRAMVMCKVGPKAYTPVEELRQGGPVRYSKVLNVSDITSPVVLV